MIHLLWGLNKSEVNFTSPRHKEELGATILQLLRTEQLHSLGVEVDHASGICGSSFGLRGGSPSSFGGGWVRRGNPSFLLGSNSKAS